MLSQCGLKYRKTIKTKRHPCNYKIRYSKKYARRSRQNYQWSKDSLENSIANSLATKYTDNPEDEPLFMQFYEAKLDLQKRQKDIQTELENVRDALKETLEKDLLPLLPKKRSSTEVSANSTEREIPSNILENSEGTVAMPEQNSTAINSVKCVTENDYSYGICKTDYNGFSVSAKAEESGNFEIRTEHSCGSIMTYITHSASGNIEIVTQVEDYEEPLSQIKSEESLGVAQLIVPQNSASTEVLLKNSFQDFHSTISKTENSTVTKTKPKVVYTQTSLKDVKISTVYENVMKILQKLNDSVVYALEQINQNISKTLESLNHNMKVALTVVVRDEIRKIITEHMIDRRTLVCSSTSHNDLCLTENAVVKDCSTSTINDVKSFLCSATTAIESFLPNKVCSAAMQTEDFSLVNHVSTSTECTERVCRSTSVADLRAPKRPSKTKSEETMTDDAVVLLKEEEAEKKSSVEIACSKAEEVKRTKRKVRSTKLTAPTNVKFGARVESEVTICSACVPLPKPLKPIVDFAELSDQEYDESPYVVQTLLVSPVFMSLDDELNPTEGHILVYVEEESSMCNNLRTAKGTEINLHSVNSASAPSSSVISEAPTEEVSRVRLTKHSTANNAFCEAFKYHQSNHSSITKIEHSEEQSSLMPKSVTSETETPRSRRRHKKRRFTKSRTKNSETLIGARGRVHKLDDVTVNKILKKNNAMCIQKVGENGFGVKNVRSLLKQLAIEPPERLPAKPHSAGCECFDCVYSEYRRKRKNSNFDRYAKIGQKTPMAQRIYDSHVQRIEDNFQQQEKAISDIEENLKEVCKCAEDNRNIDHNDVQENRAFESSLCGLKHALCSLKSRIQQIDKTIVADKPVQPKIATKNSSTKKTKAEVSTVTLFKQANIQAIASNSKGNIEKCEKRKSHKKHEHSIQRKRPATPTHFRSVQREQSTYKTLSHEETNQLKARHQKVANPSFQSKQQELMYLQSCEQELYNFLERKKELAGFPKKSVSVAPTIPPKRKSSKKQETKNKSSTRSMSEATMSKTTTTTLTRDEKSNKRHHLKLFANI